MKKQLAIIYPGGLAGAGTATQLRTSIEGWNRLAQDLDLKLVKIWEKQPLLPSPDINWSLRGTSTHGERHRAAKKLADEFVTRLNGETCAVYAFGYTSFVPWGFSEHANCAFQQARIIWGDCSPPDTDTLGTNTEDSRFVGSAYKNTDGVLYSWHVTQARSRIPEGCRYHLAAQPFAEPYLEKLKAMASVSKYDARKEITEIPTGNLMAMFCSSGIWDPRAVGAWMTEKQHQSVIERTNELLRGLEKTAQAQKKQITLFADPELQLVLKGMRYPLDVRLKRIDPDAYLTYLRASDIVITRASHSVTSAECAAMCVPQLLIPMPIWNYMNIEEFTFDVVSRQLAITPSLFTANDIAQSCTQLLDEGMLFADRATEEFHRVHAQFNFFEKIRSIILGS